MLIIRNFKFQLQGFQNRVFVSRNDVVFQSGFHGGSVRVIVFGDAWCASRSFEKVLMRELINPKVNTERIQQVNFILENFSVVTRLETHVLVHFFGGGVFVRLTRFVGLSADPFRVHPEESNHFIEQCLFIPCDFAVFPGTSEHPANQFFSVLCID